ncbi:MAG: DNA-3-methyladenine glycosylase 2 family protein [Granulosicoccus sp.]|nr:DNA-3-methyladenine glycosylase 2 family protein [Granulosicoccus sp.]
MTRATLVQAVVTLARQDPMLANTLEEFGMPPMWQRRQNFHTLVHVVLEQKVSLGSAQAVMNRVLALCPGMQPVDFLGIRDSSLRQAGISERKLSYCRSIAQAITGDELNFSRLRRCPDTQVMEQLTAVRGIGPWTAGVYLMMALRRPDAWASGDRALAVSLAECDSLDSIPDYAQLDARAEHWRPFRGAAARLLWHAYLCRRGRAG